MAAAHTRRVAAVERPRTLNRGVATVSGRPRAQTTGDTMTPDPSGARHTVMHLIDTGGPGGAETVFAQLAQRLGQHATRTLTIVPREGWLSEHLRSLQIEPQILAARGSLNVGYLWRLIRTARRHRVQLDSHAPAGLSSLWCVGRTRHADGGDRCPARPYRFAQPGQTSQSQALAVDTCLFRCRSRLLEHAGRALWRSACDPRRSR